MNKEKFKTWAAYVAMRAIRTIAQTAIALIGTSVVMGDVDWLRLASASLLAGILSVLTSIVNTPPEIDMAATIAATKDDEGE